MDEKLYALGFAAFAGIGTIRFEKLLKVFGSARNAWNAKERDIQKAIGELTGEKFAAFRKNVSVEKYARELEKKNIHFFTPKDREYPKLLKLSYSSSDPELDSGESRSSLGNSSRLRSNNNFHPPFILFAKGNVSLLAQDKTIGIVGTRKVTEYGRQVTEMLTRDLARNGFVIVSGMALGVDGIAHTTALKEDAPTVAVLGSGVDVPTPREHARLYQDILDGNGLIVSTFFPGEDAHTGSFPARNAIIAGLSLGVVVTEGAEDSGALITARYAKEYQRPVFAVPGQITSHLSKGTNNLIKSGGVAISDAYDIIGHFQAVIPNLFRDPKRNKMLKQVQHDKISSSPIEKKILALLQSAPLHFDEIARTIGKDSKAIGSLLSLMELKGMIKSSSDGKYLLVQ